MMEHLTLTIDGMTCSHCVMAVRKALAALPGVEVKDTRVGSASLVYDSSRISRSSISEAIRNAGYAIVRESA